MPASRVNQFVERLKERPPKPPAPPAREGSRSAKKQKPAIDLFDTDALAKLGNLEIASQTVVDGLLSGKHRSTHKGGYTEFSQFRPYAAGDDLRMLDWKQYAKSDRYYVRQYDDETNLQALLVVDSSGSMRFGRSTVSKWDYARMAAACLARLLMRQRDSVGLAIAAEGVKEFARPMPRASHLARLLQMLTDAPAEGESKLADSLNRLAPRLTRRGMVIVLSDCFGPVAELKDALLGLRVRGHDVLVMQVLAPEEVTFPFTRSSEFADLESAGRLRVQPAEIRRHYLEKFQAFQKELTRAMSDAGCELTTFDTSTDLGETLAACLMRRQAGAKNGRVAFAKP